MTHQSMNNMNRIIFYFFLFTCLITLLSSCEKSDSIDLYGARPVVQGYLSAGDSISIEITKEIPIGSADTIAEPLTGLDILISTGGQSIALIETQPGIYTSNQKIISELTYTLEFEYGGKLVTAHTTVPTPPVDFAMSASELAIAQIVFGGGGFPGGFSGLPDPVLLTWTNTDQSYYLTSYINTDTIQVPIFSGGPNFRGRGRIAFNPPTQGISAQIQPFQLEYYGLYHIGLLHVQPEYAALYENNNQLSSINIAPPPTNIENGLGIFTGYAQTTLNLLVKKQ